MEELTKFAEWLDDIGRLKLPNQIPPFDTPKMIVKYYVKAKKIDFKKTQLLEIESLLKFAKQENNYAKNDKYVVDDYLTQAIKQIKKLI